MSKSLGTGIDPLTSRRRYGADGLRFGLLAMSSSQDVRYSEEQRQAGRRSRERAVERVPARAARVEDVAAEPRTETVEDRWIVSRLERLTERVTELYEGFAMSHAALELYEGFWTDEVRRRAAPPLAPTSQMSPP